MPQWENACNSVVILSYLWHGRDEPVLAKRDRHELTEEAVERITSVVRSLAEDRVERGIDLNRPMGCDSCGLEKPAAGSALYGAYKLCNDCLLDFTLDLASGKVENVADFMTRRTEAPPAPPTPDTAPEAERRSVPLNPLAGRDKLMPSNEPC